MQLTFLGTGTSQGVPVIGCDCPVCRSTDPRDQRLRVALQVEVQDKILVIDIGPDFRQQMLRAGTQRVDALLLTHEHSDHVAGLDDIRPFNFKYEYDMPIYALERVHQRLRKSHAYIFDATYPGVPRVEQHTVGYQLPFEAVGIPVIPIQVMHGKLPILGYRIGNMAYLTDYKTMPSTEYAKLEGIDVLIVSALQREPHHSHATLAEALDLIQQLNVPRAYLTHLSHTMGTHAATQAELPNHVQLAYDGLSVHVDG